jgi:DMSO/TMAO reductase YedYZ molybdopterin-dependent catalytic subunit
MRETKTSVHLDRREFLKVASAAVAAAGVTPSAWADAGQTAQAFPEKVPLITLTDYPPNLEMPLKYFKHDLTPNEAFYVRWHLGIVPTRVDVATFRLKLDGHVDKPVEWSLDELKKNFEPVSVVAVNQCSGNSRSLYSPRMPGVQWGNGACGNAKWTGVPLKKLLEKAGVKAGAVEVSFDGLDGPTLPAAPNFAGTPDFIKALPFDRANDGEVLVAYEMNGKELPMLNGFPLRLVVPGWYATYWVKALNQINVLDKPFEGFWLAKGYRVPDTKDFQEDPKDLAKKTIPIHRMTVRSLFVAPEPNETVKAGKKYEVQGVAFDGGNGIAKVEVSSDDGKTWKEAKLGKDLGKYSWRRWRLDMTPAAGKTKLMVRATSTSGETQTDAQWNRSGYARNVVESVELSAS